MNEVSKETFQLADQKTKDGLIFDRMTSIDNRLAKLEGRKFLFTVSSFAGGVVGGIGTVATWAWLRISSGG